MILSASNIMLICCDQGSFLINDSDKFNEQLYGMPKCIMEGVRNSCVPLALLQPVQRHLFSNKGPCKIYLGTGPGFGDF